MLSWRIMRWLDWLERRAGGWAIPQFPLFIVAANAVIYVMAYANPLFPSRLTLIPEAVAAGEWWRVITFLFVPSRNISPFFLLLWLLLIYQYAQALENAWGEFRFFVFYALGALATVLASLLILGEPLGNVPLYTTLFLAFATLFPEFELLLFFILPVKVKYLAWLIWAGLVWSLIAGTPATRVGIGASLLNYFLFFGPEIAQKARLRWEVHRNRRRFRNGAGE